jgi:PST family polysaccharide transporter
MSVGSQIARGAAWSFASRYAGQLLQFATMVVVARYVAPEAYGLVGMVATFSAFVSLFSELGMGAAIVQRKALADEQIDSAFVLTLATGVLLAVAMWFSAPAIATFYRRDALESIARLTSVGFVLAGASIVPRALLVREFRLKRLAVFDMTAAVISAVASVTLAAHGAGTWAIVIGSLVSVATSATLLLTASGWYPRRLGSLNGARPLLRVSLNLLAFSVVNYWARSLDNLLIGVWLGERELGLYMRAYGLMYLPISQLTTVLANSMLPALSRLQDDAAAARETYLDVVGLVAFIAFPVMLGLSVLASPFLITVFGASWADATPMLQLLAPVGALQSIMNPTGWIFISRGRTDLMFRWGIVASSLTMGSLVVGARLGSGVAVAVAYLCVNVLLLVPCLLYSGRLLQIRSAHLRDTFAGTAVASAVMAGCVFGLERIGSNVVAPSLRLAILVPMGAIIYLFAARSLRVRASARAASLIVEALSRSDRSGVGFGSRSAAWLSRWLLDVPSSPTRGALRERG